MSLRLMLAAGLAFAAATTAAQAEPLKVAFAAEPYPPFTYKSSSGDWAGFEIDLAQEICKKMEVECVQAPTGWGGIIPALTSGKVDMILGSMSITEDREKVIDFTDPYYYSSAVYVAPKGTEFSGEADLKGKTLGIQGSTTHASYARAALTGKRIQMKIYDTQEQVNRDLLAGRLDIMLADQIGMAELLKRDEGQALEIVGKAPAHEAFGSGVGIGVRESDAELKEQLNVAVAAVLEDGSCSKLSNAYFGTDICGGNTD